MMPLENLEISPSHLLKRTNLEDNKSKEEDLESKRKMIFKIHKIIQFRLVQTNFVNHSPSSGFCFPSHFLLSPKKKKKQMQQISADLEKHIKIVCMVPLSFNISPLN